MNERESMDADAFFGEFRGDPEYERERALLRPRTNLAVNLLRIRRERRMTQAELAARAGMRQPRIAEIERGDYNARLDTVAKLAWALGIGAESLLAEPLAAQVERAPGPSAIGVRVG